MIKKGQLLTSLNLNNAYLSKINPASQTIVGPVTFSSGLNFTSTLNVSGAVTLGSSLTVTSNLIVNGTGTSDFKGNLNVAGTLTFKTLGSLVPWSSIGNKPSSTVANIDDSVNKKHSQNTDTGTNSSTFNLSNGSTAPAGSGLQIGSKAKPYLRWSGSLWEIYSNWDSKAFSAIQASTFKKSDGTEVSYSGHKHLMSDITNFDISGDFNKLVTITNGAEALRLKTSGSSDYVFMTFYADTQNINTRSGFIGYVSSGSSDLRIYNEMNNGNVVIGTKGTGKALVNTSEIWHAGNFDPSSKSDFHNHPYLSNTTPYISLDTSGHATYSRMLPVNNPRSNNDLIRVSSSAGGILPYANNNSYIGNKSFKFKEIHALTFYEGASTLESKYLKLSGGKLTGDLNINDKIVIKSTDPRAIQGFGSSGNITIMSNTSNNGEVIFNNGNAKINKDGQLVFNYDGTNLSGKPPFVFTKIGNISGRKSHDRYSNYATITPGLNSDMLDGYHAYDIFNNIMNLSDWGIVEGLDISSVATPGQVHVSTGTVLIKDIGLVDVGSGEAGNITLSGTGTSQLPVWFYIFITSNENSYDSKNYRPGQLCIIKGTNGQEPNPLSVGFINPIMIAKVKTENSDIGNSAIFPFKKRTYISLGASKEFQFFPYENEGSDWNKYIPYKDPNLQVKSKAKILPNGNLELEGDVVIKGKIKTSSSEPDSNLIDVSQESKKWEKAYSNAHIHKYNQEFYTAPNGSAYNFFFTSDLKVLLPSKTSVYKNGLRLKAGKTSSDTNCDFRFNGVDKASTYITFIGNAPKPGDILTYDYEEQVVL